MRGASLSRFFLKGQSFAHWEDDILCRDATLRPFWLDEIACSKLIRAFAQSCRVLQQHADSIILLICIYTLALNDNLRKKESLLGRERSDREGEKELDSDDSS